MQPLRGCTCRLRRQHVQTPEVAKRELCASLPNNACRKLATIVTCTIQGLRQALGCNHVKVSFLGRSLVIGKWNLLLSDGTLLSCCFYADYIR